MKETKENSENELFRHAFVASLATSDGNSIADGLFAIAEAINKLSRSVDELGINMVTAEAGDALRGLSSLAHGLEVTVKHEGG